jgi:hypothetical protein
VVIKNGGVSNFGNHLSTVTLYVLGFGLNIVFLYLASRSISNLHQQLDGLGRGLLPICALTTLVLISTFPRHFSFTFSDMHDYIGIALFAYEFLFSLWLITKLHDWLSLTYLMIEAIGAMLGLLSVIKVIHILFIGQVIGSIGFGLLLCFVLPKFLENLLKPAINR